MNTAMHGVLVMEQRVNVTAIADIVHDLVAGGISRLQDGGWLRQRVVIAGLSRQECAALDALRARLLDGSTVLLRSPFDPWG